MITYLPKASYKIMPWKNGKGLTSQIALGPEGSSFPDNFSWRISSAQVNSNDPFSKFSGCDRLLMVTQGAGLSLNGSHLLPLQVISFAGETEIQAELIEGPVVDLGVIFKRDSVRAEMKVLNLSEIAELSLEDGIHFIFCLRGRLNVQDLMIHAEDTVRIEKQSVIKLDGLNHSSYVLISIFPA
ncbi:HutD family protein [Bdellovibrio sp. KM01]|uniref:HutD/Ves family protein n=1 Tax=Bdellovibrio sp. KM01 TaxID=2748865 RepID=UPI0015EAD7C7|nr:HutD family protein [Bdellovibrio sp. KM01]QLY27119.1 HutD family protein [Bdellovibrio sp. KM01]